MTKLGTTLKILRVLKEDTQETVAKYLQLSRSSISKYESGQRKPDIYTLKLLARYFDVSVEYLFDLGEFDNNHCIISEDESNYNTSKNDLTEIFKDKKFINIAKLISENSLDIDVVKNIIQSMLNIKKKI